MRKLIFIVIVLAVIQNWTKITKNFDSSTNLALANESKVIMYGTRTCGYCAKARALFDSKGVVFREYDINSSSEGRRQYNALRGRGVPLIVINGNVIKGYNKTKILAALNSSL